MYLKKEISISFFITTISASNLYMPMIWLYLFLLDFLIPFLCDPDLQCAMGGAGGCAQCPVLHVIKPEKTGARSTRQVARLKPPRFK